MEEKKEEMETKPKSPRVKKIKRSSELRDTVTKIKNPGRVEAGKNLALWNKSQKERLLQHRSSKEQKEQKETKKTSTGRACCVSFAGIAYNAMHMLGFETGVSIVGYIFYKRVYTCDKSAKRSAVRSTVCRTEEKVKSTSEELIKKESDPFQMQ